MKYAQASFTGGEIAPALYNRHDLNVYQTGAEKMENFFVRPHGGASNRPGFEYLGRSVQSANKIIRLVPFVYNATDAYVLEFSEVTMRVWRNGGLVTNAGKTISSITKAYPCVVTATSHGFATGDKIIISDVLGMTELNNREFYVVKIDANSFQIGSTEEGLVDSRGYTVYLGGGEAAEIYSQSTPWAGVWIPSIRFEQTNNVLIAWHVLYGTREISRTAHNNWTVSAITFSSMAAAPGALYGAPMSHVSTNKKLSIKYRVSSVIDGVEGAACSPISKNVDREWPADASVGLKWTGPGDNTATITGITQAGPAVVTAAAHGFATGDEISIAGVSGMTEINYHSYIITKLGANTFELDGCDSSGFTAYSSGGVASQVTGVDFFRVYKSDYGVYGLIGERHVNVMHDGNIAPDTSQGPYEQGPEFDYSNEKFPHCGCFFKQRMIHGNTIDKPLTFWGSVIGDYYNFNNHLPSTADDAFELALSTDQANSLLFMVPMNRDLLLFTAGGVHRVTAGSQAFTPENISVDQQTGYGCGNLPPIIIGESVLYTQAGDQEVRDLNYDLGIDGFGSSSRTIMANHLFKDHTIVDWAYAARPDGILWCVRSDGALCGLTYLREHEITAWHVHTTDGLFKQVCVVPEDGVDRLYVVVERWINGTKYYYVERLHERNVTDQTTGVFLDSAATYEGTPTNVVTGLWHLEGKMVSVMADGHAFANQKITRGKLTLPKTFGKFTKIHVGLPYVATLTTLEPPLNTSDGPSIGRKKTLARILVRVEDSGFFNCGPEEDDMSLFFHDSEWDTDDDWTNKLHNGTYEQSIGPRWGRGKMVIQQPFPLPLTVGAVIPDVEIGE